MLLRWVYTDYCIGQGLWRGFLWLPILSTNSGLHVRSSICLSLSISWNLYRVFDEEKQRHLILAEYTVVHVGFCSFLNLSLCQNSRHHVNTFAIVLIFWTIYFKSYFIPILFPFSTIKWTWLLHASKNEFSVFMLSKKQHSICYCWIYIVLCRFLFLYSLVCHFCAW